MADTAGSRSGNAGVDGRDGQPRVLVVDDARFMRMMLCDLLTKSGLDVVGQAADGDEALDLYRRHRPDVVTLDIMMPRVDGLQVLEAILKEDPNARVIVVSAVEHNDTIRRALDLGALDYVLKPFSPPRIVEVLKRAADESGAHGPEVDEETE